MRKDIPFQGYVFRRKSGVVRKDSPFLGHNWHTSILKLEIACFYETSVSVYKATWCHNPEDHNLINHHHENP
jgi:hypothetical protein